jgi:hypothetical protein
MNGIVTDEHMVDLHRIQRLANEHSEVASFMRQIKLRSPFKAS